MQELSLSRPKVVGQQSEKWQRYLLGASLLGFTHWFFGNLYETVVLTPNLIGLGPYSLELWQQFFKFSDPIYYFIPLNPLTVLVAFIAIFKGWKGSHERRKWLGWAAFFTLATTLLTVYIVTQINVNIYFGPLPTDQAGLDALRSTQQLSAALSVLRVICEGGALYTLYQAFKLTPSEKKSV